MIKLLKVSDNKTDTLYVRQSNNPTYEKIAFTQMQTEIQKYLYETYNVSPENIDEPNIPDVKITKPDNTKYVITDVKTGKTTTFCLKECYGINESFEIKQKPTEKRSLKHLFTYTFIDKTTLLMVLQNNTKTTALTHYGLFTSEFNAFKIRVKPDTYEKICIFFNTTSPNVKSICIDMRQNNPHHLISQYLDLRVIFDFVKNNYMDTYPNVSRET